MISSGMHNITYVMILTMLTNLMTAIGQMNAENTSSCDGNLKMLSTVDIKICVQTLIDLG